MIAGFQPAYSLGPRSAHQRNAIETAFRLWSESGTLLYAYWSKRAGILYPPAGEWLQYDTASGRSLYTVRIDSTTDMIRLISSIVIELIRPGLEVIKLEFILRLKIKSNDWLIADTCPQSANHCALF